VDFRFSEKGRIRTSLLCANTALASLELGHQTCSLSFPALYARTTLRFYANHHINTASTNARNIAPSMESSSSGSVILIQLQLLADVSHNLFSIPLIDTQINQFNAQSLPILNQVIFGGLTG